MLPKFNEKTHRIGFAYGLTLVELLVAMAILSILLLALVLLFTTAIEVTHQGYLIKDNYDNARTAMTMLARDLERACELANRGEDVQFYGNPTALTFTTLLDNGRIGRVTYFFAPSPTIEQFETVILEMPEVVRNRLREIKRYKKILNQVPYESLDKSISLKEEALIRYLPEGCSSSAGEIIDQLNSKVDFELFPELNFENFPDIPEVDEISEGYRVFVQPLALFRIEEVDKSNIFDVDLKVRSGPLAKVQKIMPEPRVDIPDTPNSIQGYDVIDRLIHNFLISGVGAPLNVSMVNPLETQTNEVSPMDLRNYVNNPNMQSVTAEMMRSLIQAKEIEFRVALMQMYDAEYFVRQWYNAIRKDPVNIIALSSSARVFNIDPYLWSYDLKFSRSSQALLYQLFTGGTLNPDLMAEIGLCNYWEATNKHPEDYILADGFGAHAFWFDERYTVITGIDILFPGAMFSYQSEETISSMYINDIRNFPLLVHYLSLPPNMNVTDLECTAKLLDKIWLELMGTDPSFNAPFGSLLFKRIPNRVTVHAWILAKKPQPNISDFKRWFSQTIDIPCGLRTPQWRYLPVGM